MTPEERAKRSAMRKAYREAAAHLAHLLRTGWITEEEYARARSREQLKALIVRVALRREHMRELRDQWND